MPHAHQPVPPPRGQATVRLLLQAGRLVDLAGHPLQPGPRCTTCPGADLGDTCPMALTCPTCLAVPGRLCHRPSGHTAPRLHAARLKAADLADDAREAAGDTTLPARWAPEPNRLGAVSTMTSTEHPETENPADAEFATEAQLDPSAVCLTCLCFHDRTVPATLVVRHVESGETITACVDCEADGLSAESLAHCLEQLAKPFTLTRDGFE
nr:hypothetical protein KPHV_85780 [Kitasatospora purpeofusca]